MLQRDKCIDFPISVQNVFNMMQGIWSLWVELRIYHDMTLLIVLEEQKSMYDNEDQCWSKQLHHFILYIVWKNSYCFILGVFLNMECQNLDWIQVRESFVIKMGF